VLLRQYARYDRLTIVPSLHTHHIGYHALVILTSAILVLSSVMIPVRVATREEMKLVRMGYPIAFVAQDISRLSYGESDSPPLPRFIPLLSPLEHPVQLSGGHLLLSVVIVYFSLTAVLRILQRS
jgi:hypothetical protein